MSKHADAHTYDYLTFAKLASKLSRLTVEEHKGVDQWKAQQCEVKV